MHKKILYILTVLYITHCLSTFSMLELLPSEQYGTFSIFPLEIIHFIGTLNKDLESTATVFYQFFQENRRKRIIEKAQHDAYHFPFFSISDYILETQDLGPELKALYEKHIVTTLFLYQSLNTLQQIFKKHPTQNKKIISYWHLYRCECSHISAFSLADISQGNNDPAIMSLQYQDTITLQTFDSLIKNVVEHSCIQKIDLPNYSLCNTSEKMDKMINILQKYHYKGIITFGGNNTTIITLCCNGTLPVREDQIAFFLNNNHFYLQMPLYLQKETPLWHACSQKKPIFSVIKQLLVHGAQPNITDPFGYGFTPLHLLCNKNVRLFYYHQVIPPRPSLLQGESSQDMENQKAIIKELLQYGANPNHQNNEGWSPAHYVCCTPKIAMGLLALLINYGTDLSLINNENKTPFDLIKNQKIKQQIREKLTNCIAFNISK